MADQEELFDQALQAMRTYQKQPEPLEEQPPIRWARRWSRNRCAAAGRNTFTGRYLICELDRRGHGTWCMAANGGGISRWKTQWGQDYYR